MPLYENNLVVEVARGIKAFVALKAGVTRGPVPGLDSAVKQQPNGANPQMRQQVKNQRQQLERTKRDLSRTQQESSRLKNKLARRETAHELGSVSYEGLTLPPRNLRPCGKNFQDDSIYLSSARKEADRLVADLGLTKETSLLDVGSGPGRLAIGIRDRVGDVQRYCGVDVNEDSARWGWQYITAKHPNFLFLHIDVENTRYNPDGAASDSDFSFPFGDGEFDLITLYSVFTHMLTDGVRTYLKEFDRILRPEGRIFLTAFLEDAVPDVEENPEGYLGREWKGALHCVRYDRKFFQGLLDGAGLQLDDFDARTWSDDPSKGHGQRGLYISRKDRS